MRPRGFHPAAGTYRFDGPQSINEMMPFGQSITSSSGLGWFRQKADLAPPAVAIGCRLLDLAP
jgi:hypothetical protein